MKLLAIYTGVLLSVALGAGIFFFYQDTREHDRPFDVSAVCTARGGSWVYGSSLPLCMTPDEGLLEFVEGSFVRRDTDTVKGDGENGGEDVCVERKIKGYTGRITDVDFSSWPDASKYKTAITKDAARGVNFAGSYVVSTWGCAKNRRAAACVGHAIVDARTGKIVLYDVIGKRMGDFSVDSNMFSVTLQNGEEKMWSVENDMLVNCP